MDQPLLSWTISTLKNSSWI